MNNFQELFDFAIQIEENGKNFYQQAMQNTSNENLVLLFQYLADEETGHLLRFSELRQQAQEYVQEGSDTLDSFQFLRAFIKNVIFSPDLAQQRDALQTEKDVLRFALQRESESILYYEEIKRLFSDQVNPVLDQIIQEEIQHYLKLSEMVEKF
jgi:rubrerythrin